MRIVALLSAWLVLVFAPATLLAHPKLDEGRTAFDQGDFPTALVHLQQAEKDTALTEEELVQLYWLRAASLFALDRKTEARAAFESLLRLRPVFEPGELDASPALMAAFNAAAKDHQLRDGVILGQPTMADGQVLVFVKQHAERVGMVVISARLPGEGAYRAFQIPVEGTRAQGALLDASLWSGLGSAGVLELVLEARSPKGIPLARSGTAQQPVKLSVAPREKEAALALIPAAPPAVLPGAEPAKPVEPPSEEAADEGTGPVLGGLVAAGVMGGAAALSVLTSIVVGLVSSGAYLGLAALSQQTGGIEKTATYRAVLTTYIATLVASVLFLVLAGGLALFAGASVAASLMQ